MKIFGLSHFESGRELEQIYSPRLGTCSIGYLLFIFTVNHTLESDLPVKISNLQSSGLVAKSSVSGADLQVFKEGVSLGNGHYIERLEYMLRPLYFAKT